MTLAAFISPGEESCTMSSNMGLCIFLVIRLKTFYLISGVAHTLRPFHEPPIIIANRNLKGHVALFKRYTQIRDCSPLVGHEIDVACCHWHLKIIH